MLNFFAASGKLPIRQIGFLAAMLTLYACQDNSNHTTSQNSDSTQSATSFATGIVNPYLIDLENVWVRMGDSKGEIDKENDVASVESAEFSPDGKHIVSGSKKGWEVIMWETETGNKVWENKLDAEIEAVAFSRDGRYVAVGGEDKFVHIFNASDGKEVKQFKLQAAIDGMRFSHTGKLLVGGDEAGLIHVWRTSDWQEIHTARQGDDESDKGPKETHADINSIDFTKDDQYMSTAGRNSMVRIWKVVDMSLVRTLEGHTGSVKSARISPDGKLVASASAWPDSTGDNTIRIWDFKTGRQLAMFRHKLGMEAVEFTPDGKFLLAGGREGGGYDVANVTTGFIYVYQIPADPLHEKINLVYKKPVYRSEYLHFNNKGDRLVSSHEDGTLRLWKVITANSQ